MSRFPTVRLVIIFGAIIFFSGCGNAGVRTLQVESNAKVSEATVLPSEIEEKPSRIEILDASKVVGEEPSATEIPIESSSPSQEPLERDDKIVHSVGETTEEQPTREESESVTDSGPELKSPVSQWDVVVLGRIDACWVCQFGPEPHVSYTRVLDGEVPSKRTEGQLSIIAVADNVFPEAETPIYKSQQEEIFFLEKVVVPGYEDVDVYKVVDVKEATSDNLSTFLGQ